MLCFFFATLTLLVCAESALSPPNIITRSQWDAHQPIGSFNGVVRPRFLAVHHSALPSRAVNTSDGIRKVQLIQKMHQVKNGWTDIGYHFLLDDVGDIFQGRPFFGDQPEQLSNTTVFYQGAQLFGLNQVSIGICVIGCYDNSPELYDNDTKTFLKCDDQLTDQQILALVNLLSWLSITFKISDRAIMGHREFNYANTNTQTRGTECPGKGILQTLPSILRMVHNRVKYAGDLSLSSIKVKDDDLFQ
eukprot:TRINITY_DN1060_c0_g1_i4.p1 TRINITY_DN1060_c0_g1~~TRINITY_DN1060_c0_g1_i4.p1  ORF type:complete len:247 (-),score=52.10 TRINITY_DN1060_c0_g1_i4:136-876(-)